MRTEKIKTIAASVSILAALVFLFFSLREAPPKVDLRPDRGLGQVLAEQAIKLLGSGGRLSLITLDTSIVRNPALESQLKAFHQALQKANVTVTTINAIKLDPLRLMRVPPGDFLEIMRKKTDSDVIVSLLGPPLLTGDQRARLGERKPRIIALCSGGLPRQVDLKELFAQNLLQVAVISRSRPAPNPPVSEDPREWFDYVYQVVTPANLSELPLLTESGVR
jgi:hypothetical protein